MARSPGYPIRRLRIRTFLALLVLATTLPLAVFAGWLVWNAWQQQHALLDQQNIEQARAISAAVDQEVQRTIAALDVLTTLTPIDQPDLTQFTEIASRMITLHQGWQGVRLVTPAGTIVASTDSAWTAPTRLGPSDWVQAVAQTRRPAVSTMRHDTRGGRDVLTIGVPVIRNDAVKYVLGARLYTSAFHDILRRRQAPDGHVVTLIDTTPVIIARTRNEERYVGKPPRSDFIEHSRAAPEGVWRSVLLEGTPVYSAWSRSAVTGWTVGVGVPTAAVEGPLRRSLAALIGGGFITFAVGLLLALLLSREIVRGQTAAAAAARALARGEPVAPFHSNIAEADELAAGLRDAAAILEMRLRERDEAQRALDRNRAELLDREQTARRAAEALSRAKDEFVATVSHELRTPLNAIFGWVAMLKSGALDAAGQARALSVIDRNTRAQAQLIEDLLDMSRVIRGDVRLDVRAVDLAAVLELAVESVRPTAAVRQIELAVDAPRGAALVSGDHSRLQQIVWNLLANSLKFTPPGGRITSSVSIEGDDAVVRVSDTGEGIAPEFLPHVFDRFRQESSDVTRAHSGLGIGLSLVRHLTELHGGRIEAMSGGKGDGATFTLRLPLLGARAAHLPPGLPIEALPLPLPGTRVLEGLHALVVDDDRDARDLVATALLQAGARVTTAASAAEALESLRTHPTDIIISDIAMPNGSGFDVARSVRDSPRTAGVPLIAITAYNRPEDRDRALAAGFDDHVGKPFDPRSLVALIAGLAGR